MLKLIIAVNVATMFTGLWWLIDRYTHGHEDYVMVFCIAAGAAYAALLIDARIKR